jgi:hypothetical protein
MNSSYPLDFTKTNGNLYYKFEGHKIMLFLLYMDNLLIIGNDEETIENIKDKSTKRYKIRDFGSLSTYAHVEFLSTKHGILMNQVSFVEIMLQQFQMANSNSHATSMHEARIFTSKMYEDKVEAIMYRQIVGKLLYLTNNRPNITFATNILFTLHASSSKAPHGINKVHVAPPLRNQ